MKFTQVSKFCKAFASHSSANIELSKSQLHKIGQSRGFLGKLLGPLNQNLIYKSILFSYLKDTKIQYNI